ncbi:uncharacterized protein LAESUDRAFT_717781 [Laetiporus sulphureus 93-53]|uniref:Uncharacterized protein n=1 Tax=Laetiporus sulphureus 93-53 TaxID=1314785 RepID=A0A165BG07_9APHY|nr:uncharacterized protein LAESUDRAFT_717781 [Laetiporus sulphureus 93-53]KZT00979.1 hypothetical protein LAESUDRAFT_717781 [Laetiporus sulphureus 93-53]
MSTSYSSLFASGLFAPLPHDYAPPLDPTTPRQAFTPLPSSFSLTGLNESSDGSVVQSSMQTHIAPPAAEAPRPNMRRRKSSVSTSINPSAALKSKPASARQTMLVSRARSGSVHDAHAPGHGQTQSVPHVAGVGLPSRVGSSVGGQLARTRSGSVGGHIARLRRLPRRAAPPLPAPPPNAPLPALPPSSSHAHTFSTSSTASVSTPDQPAPSLVLPLPTIATPPKRPALRRAYTADSVSSPLLTPSASELAAEMQGEFEYGYGFPSVPSTPGLGGYEPAVREREGLGTGLETGVQMDYPSPVEGPGYFLEPEAYVGLAVIFFGACGPSP